MDAPRDQAWEALLGLETLERGRTAIKWSGGSWAPDVESLTRAAAMGVEIPDYILAHASKKTRSGRVRM